MCYLDSGNEFPLVGNVSLLLIDLICPLPFLPPPLDCSDQMNNWSAHVLAASDALWACGWELCRCSPCWDDGTATGSQRHWHGDGTGARKQHHEEKNVKSCLISRGRRRKIPHFHLWKKDVLCTNWDWGTGKVRPGSSVILRQLSVMDHRLCIRSGLTSPEAINLSSSLQMLGLRLEFAFVSLLNRCY